MIAFLSWYFIISLLGWLSLPLVYRLFRALPDRGYSLARAAGLLAWGYVFWLLASLHFVQNDVAGLLLAALVILGASAWALSGQQRELAAWLKDNWGVILSSELLFLVAFAAMAVIRAANPEIYGTEKPMELAFINATLRSPSFPPHDPWLSGYAISYYHFGYILTAMLARLSAVPGTLAFNLMLALVFGMGALSAYGVLYNLLAVHAQGRAPAGAGRSFASGLAFLGPLFFLLVSNVEGFLEMLHRRGLFWRFNPDGTATSKFWSWLDIKDLVQLPSIPLGWTPDRYLWWWRASRVVQDYDLKGNPQEIIDEFPAFSFVLGDLHPHILAIPFGLLLIGFALNLYLGGLRGSTNLFGARLHITPAGFLSAALLLGGLAFLNIWDILMAAGLIGLAYVLVRVREAGWSWERLEDLLLLGIPLGVVGVLLYLPFFLSFSSQAGGILPNLANPARGAHLWVMFGTLLVPIFLLLLYLQQVPGMGRWKTALAIALGVPLGLWVISWLIAWVISAAQPDFVAQLLSSQGMSSLGSFFAAASLRRLGSIAGLLTLALVLLLVLRGLVGLRAGEPEETEETASTIRNWLPEPLPFVLLMIALGTLLVLAPEFIYLRDQFGTRMNTIFKFYYQAWLLWSLAAAFGIAFLGFELRRSNGPWLLVLIPLTLILLIGLTYPVLAFINKTNSFNPPNGYTLNDFDRIRRENPDEAGAIDFLRSAPDGVVAEAIGGSYSGFARISTYTGLPTVLGWPGHEVQWRGTAEPQGTRQEDIALLYTAADWPTARTILDRYHILYVVVGGLERQAYAVQEEKFRINLLPVYQTGTISIYKVPYSQ